MKECFDEQIQYLYNNGMRFKNVNKSGLISKNPTVALKKWHLKGEG